jgi:hypothetical protein
LTAGVAIAAIILGIGPETDEDRPGSTAGPTATLSYMASAADEIPLTYIKDDPGNVSLPDTISVYPGPGAALSSAQYDAGVIVESFFDDFSYPLCVCTEVIKANRICNLPEALATRTHWPTQSPDLPPCHDLHAWTGTDFRPYITVSLDGTQISGRQLDPEDGLEVAVLWDTWCFCYRLPLEVGRHTVAYAFDWPELAISSAAAWEFTITP